MLDETLRAAACKVICDPEYGTGFLVSPNRIMTCRHCVAGAISEGTAIIVNFPASAKHPEVSFSATVVDESVDLDVCILSFDGEMDRQVIEFARALPREGKEWLAFGFPRGTAHLAHRLEGRVASVMLAPAARNDIQLSVAPEVQLDDYRGVSGAPLIVEGKCYGVARLKANGSLWAISCTEIRPFLASNRIDSAETSSLPRAPHAERRAFVLEFEEHICKLRTGTVFLEGCHGIGKTTFCSSFSPTSQSLLSLGCYSMRIPGGNTSTAYRAQPEILYDWLLTGVSLEITGKADRIQTKSYSDTVTSTENLLQQFSDYCERKNQIGVFFIDGVDDIARLGNPALSTFIGVLPMQMPQNVVCVMSGPSVATVCGPLAGRISTQNILTLPKLDRASAARFCYESLNHASSRANSVVDRLCDRANGHPLYLQYLIRYVNEIQKT